MARGENAERRGHHREYWSRRHGGLAMSWAKPAKRRTHRAERQQAKALVASALLALGGCTLVDADSQIRVTEHAGAGTAGVLVGGAELAGIGCIVSVAGELPHALELAYVGDRCNVHFNRRDDNALPFGE